MRTDEEKAKAEAKAEAKAKAEAREDLLEKAIFVARRRRADREQEKAAQARRMSSRILRLALS